MCDLSPTYASGFSLSAVTSAWLWSIGLRFRVKSGRWYQTFGNMCRFNGGVVCTSEDGVEMYRG